MKKTLIFVGFSLFLVGTTQLCASSIWQPLLTARDAQTLIQGAYDKVVEYGDGDIPGLKFKLSNFRVLTPEDFAAFPALDEATQASGYLIRVAPATYTLDWAGARGVHLQMKWDRATEQEEQETQIATRDLSGWSTAKLEELASLTDPNFAKVDRIVLYHVEVASRAMERDYEAAFVWATGTDGQQRVFPQDEITGGVAWAMIQVLPPVRSFEQLEERSKRLRGASTSNPGGIPASGTICVQASSVVMNPPIGSKPDSTDHSTGFHQGGMTMGAKCSANADCTSHCTPQLLQTTCAEFGQISSFGYKHVASTAQQLGGDTELNAASKCGAAFGCAVTRTTVFNNGSVGFNVMGSGATIAVTPNTAVLANMSQSDNAVCPAAVVAQTQPLPPPPNQSTGPSPESPILIDLEGNGIDLSGPDAPVEFDLNADGIAEKITWTSAESDDGFLCLDRNGNGVIDNGAELFGNATRLHDGTLAPNGYAALREFDLAQWGGNGNGAIDPGDAVYSTLRVWVDANHNGISEPSELLTLQQAGIIRISLDYLESRHQDQYGNQFRFVSLAWKERPGGSDRLVVTSDVFFLLVR